jgi:hypothetical protein
VEWRGQEKTIPVETARDLIRWGYEDRMDAEGRKIFEISIYSTGHSLPEGG